MNLYCKTPFGRMHNRNPEIIGLAKLLGRSPSSVGWKLVNFASFDSNLKKRGIKGAVNVSHLDREIWEEFNSDWEKLAFDSESLLAKEMGRSLVEVIEDDTSDQLRSGKDRKAIVKIRVNQGFFRRMVLAAYEFRCCVTGLAIPDLLNASHIIPWSSDERNRMNPRNGLCLNAIHDRAFDRGLMTITPDHRVLISKSTNRLSMRSEVAREMLTKFDGEMISLPRKFLPDSSFLEYHNKHIFRN